MFGALPLLLLLVFSFVHVPSSAGAKGATAQSELARPFLDEEGSAERAGAPTGKSFVAVMLSGPFLITLTGVFLGSSAYGFIDPVVRCAQASLGESAPLALLAAGRDGGAMCATRR
eukprot:362999-Prymnesium_polylepis.2